MQFFRFLKWQWNKWEFWQKIFMISILTQLLGALLPAPYGMILTFSGISVVLGFAVKWFIWDSAVKNWKLYQDERQNIFNKVKDSHK